MKNVLFLGALCTITCLSLLTSCGNDDDNIQPQQATDFMPLEVGAFWVYEFSVNNQDQPSIDTITVVDSYPDGEDTVFELSSTNSFMQMVFFPERLRLSDGDLYADTEDNNFLYLTADLAVTATDLYTKEVHPDLGSIIYRYQPVLQAVETPAGNFDCINIEGEVVALDTTEPIHGLRIDNFFARDVGLVNAKTYFWSNAAPVEIELLDFQLP